MFVVPVKAEDIERQHERAQKASRDYLKRLNSEDNVNVNIEELGPEDIEDMDISSPTSEPHAAATIATQGNISEKATPQSEESASWLNKSNEAGVPTASESNEQSTSDPEELSEEMEDLERRLRRITQETDHLHSTGIGYNNTKVQKMMLEDIAKQTFKLEKDIEELVEISSKGDGADTGANSTAGLEGLQARFTEQKKVNDELFELAEQQRLFEGSEIKDLTNSKTLEEIFKSAAERYTVPDRLSAFKIVAQSRLNGTLLDAPPTNIDKHSKWELTYAIEELDDQKGVETTYVNMLKKSDNASIMSMDSRELRYYFNGSFFQQLMKLSRKGKAWREARDKEDEGRDVVVFEPKN